MMKRFKVFKISVIMLSVAAIFFTGCQKEENDNFGVNTDVIFLHKVINNDTLTGVSYYVYGNQGMSEATVTLPNEGGTVELERHPGSSYTFYKDPADEDYVSEENFSVGSYIFNVMSKNGESIEITDIQELDDLGFALLDSTDFDEVQKYYYFDWENVEGAQSYVAMLLDSEGETIFTSYPIDDSTPNYYISTHYDFGTWSAQPQNGETYTLRIQSYLYDSDATNSDYVYNIQEISIADYPLVWELD